MKAADYDELVAPEGYCLEGDQLEMFAPWMREDLPWQGQSPRALTKAHKAFSLGAPPTGVLRQ